MDFDYTSAEEAFRQELRTWLAANRPEGYDPDVFEQFDFHTRFAIQRNWQRKLAAAGWVGVGWPKEYGGRGATISEQAIYHQELGRVAVPGMANEVALNVVGPAMLHHGAEEQKKRYLSKMLNAEEIWCQGYSEHGAGSDFAAVQTEAVEDGDYFVVNGHKIWTTFATISDYCLLIVRTDPDVPKHKGLSALLVDMQTPGITVKPLVQMNGDPEFAEVLFKQVRVPKTNLLGEKNHGWEVSMTSLCPTSAPRVAMPLSWNRPSANWQRWRSRYNFMVALRPKMLRCAKSWRSSTFGADVAVPYDL